MKWTRSELLKNSVHVNFDEDVTIDAHVFDGNLLIEDAKDVHVSGSGFLDDENDRFYCELRVEGTMIVPDSITGEAIEYPFVSDRYSGCSHSQLFFVADISGLPASGTSSACR